MSDFITRYPYQFDEREKPYYDQYAAACLAVNERGPIDVQALVSGTLPEGTPGVGPVIHLTDELVAYFNGKYNPFDPLYNDAAYAKAAGFAGVPAIMTIAAYDDAYLMPIPHEARDVMLVAGLNHSVTSHRPIYAGDTLYLVVNERRWKDVTPETGSDYRWGGGGRLALDLRRMFDAGRTVDDARAVVRRKRDEWRGSKRMAQHIRPETLFGEKFESYLNEKGADHADAGVYASAF